MKMKFSVIRFYSNYIFTTAITSNNITPRSSLCLKSTSLSCRHAQLECGSHNTGCPNLSCFHCFHVCNIWCEINDERERERVTDGSSNKESRWPIHPWKGNLLNLETTNWFDHIKPSSKINFSNDFIVLNIEHNND